MLVTVGCGDWRWSPLTEHLNGCQDRLGGMYHSWPQADIVWMSCMTGSHAYTIDAGSCTTMPIEQTEWEPSFLHPIADARLESSLRKENGGPLPPGTRHISRCPW